ncbi:DUF5615 family PIN-like protein [Dehalococcoidia bacterium]|nr:DUF5615 family PIN-like protein [Dehalococcoidia bacterium]
MRIKLDENVDARLTMFLRGAGHDTTTVQEQGLRGTGDEALLFPTMRVLVETLIDALTREWPAGRLWIVEPGRLRIHAESDSE